MDEQIQCVACGCEEAAWAAGLGRAFWWCCRACGLVQQAGEE